jgi:hypothetical protein
MAVERRKRPGVAAFQGGGGAPVAGEGNDASYSWRRRWGMRRGEVDGQWGGAHRKGQLAAGAASLPVASACFRRLVVDMT